MNKRIEESIIEDAVRIFVEEHGLGPMDGTTWELSDKDIRSMLLYVIERTAEALGDFVGGMCIIGSP